MKALAENHKSTELSTEEKDNAAPNLSYSVVGDEKIHAYIQSLGIQGVNEIIYNPSYDDLFREETDPRLYGYEKGVVTETGAVNVDTGKYTGRSPKDKYIVRDAVTENTVWWTNDANKNDNKAISQSVWQELKACVANELSNKRLFVVDGYCGANKNTCLRVRFVVEVAWQAHFVKNMFIRPSKKELENFEPDFVVINGSKAKNTNWQRQGLNSETFVAFNLSEKVQLIGGTWYGGEMKKGLFSMMNYFLPLQGIASMHSSANVGEDGDVAVFFGLSGTGKTTLSADPKRALIGDDEHGWDDEGVFNLEGGCYAKTIDLDPEKEPDIYRAIRRDALLENVGVDDNGKIDFSDRSKTENTRVSYPIYHIENIVKPVSKAGHAKKIIFLTADAFGVLPPVAKLTPEQAQYHYLSGFTAKVAGTELGVTEPTPTFSSCFGQAFLSLHPTKYAQELVKRMNAAGASAYMVNTGWNGSGKRISLPATRAIIDAIMDGSVDDSETTLLPYFNLAIPSAVSGVEKALLDPRSSYADSRQWDKSAQKLARLFVDNFKKFTDTAHGSELEKSGPQL